MDEQAEKTAPESPSELPRRSWSAVTKRTFKELLDDELADRAAALTYYGVLSLFPALLVLVSLLGVVGLTAAGVVAISADSDVADYAGGGLIALGILDGIDLASHARDSAASLHPQIEAIKLAFADRRIASLDHPVVRRLRGLA